MLLLKDKIKGQMPIRVIGDYDADGICSSYILKRGLEACGAVVDTMIPHLSLIHISQSPIMRIWSWSECLPEEIRKT